MIIIILIFCGGMACVLVVEWLKIKSFSEDEKFIVSILYGFVGVATNLAAGLVYGKPYFPFYVSGAAILGAFVRDFWQWQEKLCTLLLPIMMSVRYFWIGYRQRQNN